MSSLPLPKNAPNIGECIYCGTKEGPLSREHAVPYALHGEWTLLNASCRSCAGITSRFEKDSLGLYDRIRTVMNMRTRHPERRSITLPVVVAADGGQTIEVPLMDYPVYLPIPVFLPPGIIDGRPLAAGMPVLSLSLQPIAGPTYQEAQTRHGHDFAGTRHSFSPELFALTLAKIAYCAAIYVLGLDPLRNSPLRGIILGDNHCLGHFVGSWNGEIMNVQQGPVALQVRSRGGTVDVFIRFFAQFGAPEYHVVVGTVDQDFVKSPEWPWK